MVVSPTIRNLLCALVLTATTGISVFPQATLLRRDEPVEYRLGAGDQLSLHVTDLDEISDKPVRIDPDGNIDLPLIGIVHAAGLTPTQLKVQLTTQLTKYITAPRVTVNVTDNASRPVSVLGAVTHAGVYQLQGPRTLVEVLSLAGGTAPDAGPTVVITRQAQWGQLQAPGLKAELNGATSSLKIPLEQLTSATNPAANITIQPNDVVSVPKAEVVYVVGNVRKAGGFTLSHHETLSVLQAISLAEGFSPDAAASHARILRRSPEGDSVPPREIKVDASKILAGKEPDQPLYANDILFIPNSAFKASSKRMIEAAIGVSTGVLVYR